MERTIKILDYTEYPGPRYSSLGSHSGEDYYHSILNKAFYEAVQKEEILKVDLDNTAGYASSFLDEAFGNLVYDFGLNYIQNNLRIKSDIEPDWIDLLRMKTFVKWAEKKKNHETRKMSERHSDWYGFDTVAGRFECKQWEYELLNK